MIWIFPEKTHLLLKMITNPDGSNVDYLLLQQQHMKKKWAIDEEV
ncbi:MAG: hypothetical protein RLN88_02540 [Ekhidna sp.]